MKNKSIPYKLYFSSSRDDIKTSKRSFVFVHVCKLLWFLVSKIHQKCRTMQKLRCFPRKILNVIHGTERRRSRGGNCKEFRKARSKHRIQKTQNSELQRVQKSGLETGIFKIFSLNHGFLKFNVFTRFLWIQMQRRRIVKKINLMKLGEFWFILFSFF